ncbi:hypothetical protein TNCV_5005091 [Trichonephila clavipes]|uniref:Uncharacterized protein n=1 Tax=Trichonephila clavipes TaxID=2585209 RepID=A0A8X6RCC6_TRICX|nr:hypothetical protein TNCV_5005091 [Trichonephila clavipes]
MPNEGDEMARSSPTSTIYIEAEYDESEEEDGSAHIGPDDPATLEELSDIEDSHSTDENSTVADVVVIVSNPSGSSGS